MYACMTEMTFISVKKSTALKTHEKVPRTAVAPLTLVDFLFRKEK